MAVRTTRDYLGHDKEPPPRNKIARGRRPFVHSHSARPKRSLKTGGRKR